MNDVNAVQVGGSHYKGTGYQHWDFVMIALDKRYLEGNITKYLSRWRQKNGLQDLQKARHYLSKLIQEFGMGNTSPLSFAQHRGLTWNRTAEYFCDENRIGGPERSIIVALANWRGVNDLHSAAAMLDGLIAQVEAEAAAYADEEARVRDERDGGSGVRYETDEGASEDITPTLPTKQ